MAKKPTTKEPGTAVMSWRDKMAQDAAKQSAMEQSSGGGKFFSIRAGQLKFDDVALPGNQIAAIILHTIYENVFYEGSFDPDLKTPPACFAFWDPEYPEEMQPHEEVDKDTETFTRQSDVCDGCPQNEWGSAEKGRGKACSNRRRLALIPAGTYVSLGKNKGLELNMFDEEEPFKAADIAYMKLPVTSVKNYSRYVREISEQLGKPTWAVFTNITVVPDDKSQFKVDFELLEEVPDEMMDIIFKRQQEAEKEIAFPYRPAQTDDEASAPATKSSAAKKLTGGKAPAKGRQPAKKATR